MHQLSQAHHGAVFPAITRIARDDHRRPTSGTSRQMGHRRLLSPL